MRKSGILLHLTSLPSPFGIGDMGPSAFAMVDFLKKAGQHFWQVLPVNPTDGINGHSPYSCFSALAGNPLLISPAQMIKDGFLTAKDVAQLPRFRPDQVDYDQVVIFKEKLFAAAYQRWLRSAEHEPYRRFCDEERPWLEDYAVFITAKHVYKGQGWNQWPAGLKNRSKPALGQFIKRYADDIQKIQFIQYLFFKQWQALAAYAHANGIKLIGDIPIYVNYDSVDVWCYPDLFKLNDKGGLKFVSGCPPDYFSKTGQRWGNPVYDWNKLKKTKYLWWEKRIEHNLKLFDCLRIDHFRGFASFWQIPAHERLAIFGRWVNGPGEDFFKTLSKKFKHLPVIAEDLGEITPDVVRLMKNCRFPGMRVLLFAFGGDLKTNPHLPHNYPVDCIAYTGTHDNNTVRGWYQQEAKAHEKANLARVLGIKPKANVLHWQMIEALMKSKAGTVIIPLADVMGLGAEARMNTPATKVHNWKWRFGQRQLVPVLAGKLRHLTKKYKRD